MNFIDSELKRVFPVSRRWIDPILFFMIDLEYAMFAPRPFFNYADNSEYWINKNAEILLEAYHKMEAGQLLNDSESKQQEIFLSKKCRCGGNLRYIGGNYDFWGCENYRNKLIAHTTFDGKQPTFRRHEISKDWLETIIKTTGLKGKVKWGKLLDFYTISGLPDLKFKYNGIHTMAAISSLISANERSKEQEKRFLKLLQRDNPHGKITTQQCIKYKIKLQKETFCIPDFICALPDRILVIDAKMDYVNDEKMDLYTALVEHIACEKEEPRLIYGAHMMDIESISQYQKSRYHLIIVDKDKLSFKYAAV